MQLFLLSFLIITVSVAGLALGIIVRKRPVKPGCGKYGGAATDEAACDLCASADGPQRGRADREDRIETMGYR